MLYILRLSRQCLVFFTTDWNPVVEVHLRKCLHARVCAPYGFYLVELEFLQPTGGLTQWDYLTSMIDVLLNDKHVVNDIGCCLPPREEILCITVSQRHVHFSSHSNWHHRMMPAQSHGVLNFVLVFKWHRINTFLGARNSSCPCVMWWCNVIML